MDDYLKMIYEQECKNLSDKYQLIKECRLRTMLNNTIGGLDEEHMVPVKRTFTGTNTHDTDIEILKKLYEADKDRQCKVVELSEETKQYLDACFKYLQELSKLDTKLEHRRIVEYVEKPKRALEKVGTYKDCIYVITITDKEYLNKVQKESWSDSEYILNSYNYRCGYVRVPVELVEKTAEYDEYGDYEYKVHGGITYENDSVTFVYDLDIEKDDKYTWLGFDCNHGSDTIEQCTLEYCIEHCKKLIDQIII